MYTVTRITETCISFHTFSPSTHVLEALLAMFCFRSHAFLDLITQTKLEAGRSSKKQLSVCFCRKHQNHR